MQQAIAATGLCLSSGASALPLVGAPATAAAAELRVHCALAPDCTPRAACPAAATALDFAIDEAQFAPPLDPQEPPRRKVTQVRLGAARFTAEAIMLGQTLGFHEDGGAMGARLFTLGPDGRGVYSEEPSGRRLTGPCEVTQ